MISIFSELQKVEIYLLYREGVGYVITQMSCILFIMLTTTCFGQCGPSSGHKMYIEENYREYVHNIGAYSKISGLKNFRETRRYWKLRELTRPYWMGILLWNRIGHKTHYVLTTLTMANYSYVLDGCTLHLV